MKVTGIIAEYNPFHDGHQYHIEESKRRTGSDYIIAVMSGSFVQRGAPAVISKYDRARMALHHGADIVFELPGTAALSSAEGFATGGVSLLAGLGVVDSISCGCEMSSAAPGSLASEDRDNDHLFDRVVSILTEEPEEYRQILASGLKSGMSFPAARENAVLGYMHTRDTYGQEQSPARADTATAVRSILSGPNSILAVEYARAIRSAGIHMDLVRIPRRGSGYHDDETGDGYSSAAAVRKSLLSSPGFDSLEENVILGSVPLDIYESLVQCRETHSLLTEDDFSDLLFYAITRDRDRLGEFGPASSDLTQRIARLLEHFTTWTAFADIIKTKNQTYTAISRCLAHILLDITRDDLSLAAEYRYAPYARLLGFRTEAAPLMKSIWANADIPIITHPAQDRDALDSRAKHLFDLDLQASEIYRRILQSHSGREIRPELRQPLVLIP